MPSAGSYVSLELFEKVRIVLLRPGIFHGSFETEFIVGVFVEQREVLYERVVQILVDGSLHRPSPLCVEMSVGNHVDCRFVLGVGFYLCHSR